LESCIVASVSQSAAGSGAKVSSARRTGDYLDYAQDFNTLEYLAWRSLKSRIYRAKVPETLRRAPIAPSPNVSITYCRLCGWLLRAAWMGQELLSTFAEELRSLTLVPDDTGGVFEVRVDGKTIWSRADAGRFPEIKELKQLVRDQIAPGRDLGHVDPKEAKS
jgi:selenoprotein W-related protein